MTDVIIFNIEQKRVITNNKRKLSPSFESLTDRYISKGVKEIILKWIDSIKFKDKIIKREPRIVNAIMFEEFNKLLVFSESESEIEYFRIRIEEKYNIYIKELNLYTQLSSKFVFSSIPKIKVIAINIKGQFNEEKLINISDSKEDLPVLLKTNEEKIISITFMLGEDNYFIMDKRSVISVPDNLSEEDKIELYKGLFLYA